MSNPNTERDERVTNNSDEGRIAQIRKRQNNRATNWWDVHGRSMIADIDFLLTLLDRSAAGDSGTLVDVEEVIKLVDVCTCGSGPEFRSVAMRYHPASCQSHMATLIRALPTYSATDAATRMREACVGKVKDYRLKCEQTGVDLADKEDESSQRMYWRADGAADALEIVEGELSSLTLDTETERHE